MKTLILITAVLLALPLRSALAEDAKPADPVEACKGKAGFIYNFDMMNIERDEWDRKVSHDLADMRKQRRTDLYMVELKACEELKEE